MSDQQQTPTLTLDGITYQINSFSDEMKGMASDLMRTDQKLAELLYETRIKSLAKDYLIGQIKAKAEEAGILGTPSQN